MIFINRPYQMSQFLLKCWIIVIIFNVVKHTTEKTIINNTIITSTAKLNCLTMDMKSQI